MKTLKLPKTHHFQRKIWGKIYPGEDMVYLTDFAGDMTDQGYFLVHTIDEEIPLDWTSVGEPKIAQVAALKQAIQKVRAEAQNSITQIESEINQLLELEYIPAREEL